MEEYSAAHTKHLEINFADKNDSIEIILSTFKLISSFFPLCVFLFLFFFFSISLCYWVKKTCVRIQVVVTFTPRENLPNYSKKLKVTGCFSGQIIWVMVSLVCLAFLPKRFYALDFF